MDYKQLIAQNINIEGFTCEDIYSFIEVPPTKEVGDYALPCFKFSKALRKAPPMIANDLKASFPQVEGIASVEAVGGYLNFRLDRAGFIGGVLQRVLAEGENYGASKMGEGKTVCIDYSSVNIAKPFHIGHLSTTVIGAALYRIYKFLGYNTVGINHLGDYGTQFGKLIYAFKTWGDKAAVDEKGLAELTRLYVLYHEVAEKTPEIDDVARSYFKKIEDGDKECVELFEYFKSITLKEIAVAANMPTPEELPRAHKFKELHEQGRDDLIPYTAMELTTVVAEALRMCRLENGPDTIALNMIGLRIGSVAFVGLPGEPFTDIGKGIKEATGWDMILPCALTNGSNGYFPMRSAFDEGGYEARSSNYKGGVAEAIIEAGKEILAELKK